MYTSVEIFDSVYMSDFAIHPIGTEYTSYYFNRINVEFSSANNRLHVLMTKSAGKRLESCNILMFPICMCTKIEE